jgi:hypothetical protein
MDASGSDGKKIGQVREVRDQEFLVSRPMGKEIFVPFSACQADHDQVVLNVNENQVDQQNWRTLDIGQFEGGQPHQ